MIMRLGLGTLRIVIDPRVRLGVVQVLRWGKNSPREKLTATDRGIAICNVT